jgi:hypothetical protein
MEEDDIGIHDPYESDYETANDVSCDDDEDYKIDDSDEEASIGGHGQQQELQSDAPSFLWTLLYGVLQIIKVSLKCLTFVTLACFVCECLMVLEMEPTALTVDRSPCFISNMPEDTATVWSQRCMVATVAHQMMPCPRGGFCQGGKLVSCKFDGVADPFVPSLDSSSCNLAPDANVTFDALF